jgi:sterol desaturase/sphingolipid hydroxylase (fatty acid hydroxylase superfamily)
MTLPLPTFEQFLYEMAGSLIIEEFCFYWSHRLLHSKALYGPIHKMHHEFTAPIGVAALYCHPCMYPPLTAIATFSRLSLCLL